MNPIRKGLAIGVFLLFIGLAFAPSINANIGKLKFDPIPDLVCEGSISIVGPESGQTYTGSFAVENIGEANSTLDWAVVDWPDCGSWVFEPEKWYNQTPEDGQITIDVTIIWPEDFNDTGAIRVENCENPEDYCIIDIIISPPPPPQKSWLIGLIHGTEISNESVQFHADFVFVFWLILPMDIIINKEISLSNNYWGYVGNRFIFARFTEE